MTLSVHKMLLCKTNWNYFQYLLQGTIHQQQQHDVCQESDRLLNHSSPLTPSHPVGRAQSVQKLSRWHRWGFTSVTAEFTAVPAVALMFDPFTKLLIKTLSSRIFSPYFTGLKVICSYSVLCNQGGLVSIRSMLGAVWSCEAPLSFKWTVVHFH